MDIHAFVDQLEAHLAQFSASFPFEILVGSYGKGIRLIVINKETREEVNLERVLEQMTGKG